MKAIINELEIEGTPLELYKLLGRDRPDRKNEKTILLEQKILNLKKENPAWSVKKLARTINISDKKVNKILRKAGIKKKRKIPTTWVQHILSEDEVNKLKELVSQEKSINEIAEEMNLSYNKTFYEMRKNGLKIKKFSPRGKKTRKNLSEDEIKTIKEMLVLGNPVTEIAKAINWGYDALRYKIRGLKLGEEPKQ